MKISKKKKDKIFEQILFVLYSASPQPLFTSQIAQEIARDEEFIKQLLIELNTKNLVVKIKKNPQGRPYTRRLRWILGDKTYQTYKNHQNKEVI